MDIYNLTPDIVPSQGLIRWIVRNLIPRGVIPAIGYLQSGTKKKVASPAEVPSDGSTSIETLVHQHILGYVNTRVWTVKTDTHKDYHGEFLGAYYGGSRANHEVFCFGLDYDAENGVDTLQMAKECAQKGNLDLAWFIKKTDPLRWHAHGLLDKPYKAWDVKTYLEEVFKSFPHKLEIFPKASGPTAQVGNFMRLPFNGHTPYFPEGWVSWEVSPMADLKPLVLPEGFKSPDRVITVGESPSASSKTTNTHTFTQSQSHWGFDLRGYDLDKNTSATGPHNFKTIYRLRYDYGLTADQLLSLVHLANPDKPLPSLEDAIRAIKAWKSRDGYPPEGWKRNQMTAKFGQENIQVMDLWMAKAGCWLWSRRMLGQAAQIAYLKLLSMASKTRSVTKDHQIPWLTVASNDIFDDKRNRRKVHNWLRASGLILTNGHLTSVRVPEEQEVNELKRLITSTKKQIDRKEIIAKLTQQDWEDIISLNSYSWLNLIQGENDIYR
jgi:hypothetical protein